MTIGNHFSDVVARSRGNAEAVARKGAGDVQARDFFHRADNRNFIGAFITGIAGDVLGAFDDGMDTVCFTVGVKSDDIRVVKIAFFKKTLGDINPFVGF